MSVRDQTINRSASNFTAIFDAASDEFTKLTGQDLSTHPTAAAFESCNSPDAALNVFRTQAHAFDKSGRDNERLWAWLTPTVHILYTFSTTLAEGIGLPFPPAKVIFTSIGVLLAAARDFSANFDTLVSLFERIQLFVQRLNRYTDIPLTADMTELLGKLMAHVLSIFALSIKEMKEGRIKKYLKRLAGATNVERALQRLDMLTKEEILMTVARNLEVTHDVDDNVKVTKELTRGLGDNVKLAKAAMDHLTRGHLRGELRKWLGPPDPSANHNTARATRHDGTGKWFTEGRTFEDWKMNGSLLWVHGNPGTGKSILCSAIIEDIKCMQEAKSALVAFYYFDFKDAAKRDHRGMLSSLLFQLGENSERCWDVLYQLYTTCHEGSEQPSQADLAQCLRGMVELPGQLPIYLLIDALDECPNTNGTPSARENVLGFVEEIVESNLPNLFICITSRPEQDIQTVLNPLTSTSRRVSLHEEGGQREDINSYIRSFVHRDRAMRRWRAEDKALVIKTLSERAGGMFRWVFCQLDTLRRCMPSSIRKTLDELPTTLDDTYERALEGVPKEKKQDAHRLFQCLVVAIRPLRVEELAEIFAIEFHPKNVPNLLESWRPENAEEAVLSACSTLITITDNEGSRIVQFSHFSVREFLISDRPRTSHVVNTRHYHISLGAAHTILARACLTVLLQLDENVNKKRLATFPLALYAAQHWFDHAKFDDVASRIQDPMERLFDPTNPYLASWVWIRDADSRLVRQSIGALPEHPSQPGATALYYAVLCGLAGLADYLISTHAEDVNAKCGRRGTPLHAASYKGHLDAVRLLLDHGADVNTTNNRERTPLCEAYSGRHLELMRLLVKHGANVDVRYSSGLILHDASARGQADVVDLLLRHKADVDARGSLNWTPLHWVSSRGNVKVAQLLLEHGADINALSTAHNMPLHLACDSGHPEMVRILLGHGADVHGQGGFDWTPLQIATSRGHIEVAQLLLEHGAEKE